MFALQKVGVKYSHHIYMTLPVVDNERKGVYWTEDLEL